MTTDFVTALKEALTARPARRATVDDARDAAVLVPIVGGDEPALIFTVRTEHLPSHQGQISFPGGSIDPDDASAEAAALREANEEIGLDPAVVTVVGELDHVPTFVSGYVIAPVVGWIESTPALRPNPGEVAEVLTVPVADITDDIRSLPGFVHRGRSYPTEAWVWNDYVIWGATARVLRVLLYRLAEAGLADHPGEEPPWIGPVRRASL
jgi:8-oxo-dGTP pyrophosphatase MutT (NUDIX family)